MNTTSFLCSSKKNNCVHCQANTTASEEILFDLSKNDVDLLKVYVFAQLTDKASDLLERWTYTCMLLLPASYILSLCYITASELKAVTGRHMAESGVICLTALMPCGSLPSDPEDLGGLSAQDMVEDTCIDMCDETIQLRAKCSE